MEKEFFNIANLCDSNNGKETFVVIAQLGDDTLIRRNTEYEPWVVAWCYNPEKGYWCQGHYFSDFFNAVSFMKKRNSKEKSRIIDADQLITNFRNSEDSEYSKWTLSGIITEIEDTIYDTEHESEIAV